MSFELLTLLGVLLLSAILYSALPARFRWLLLLSTSILFYSLFRLEHLLLIFLSTILDYSLARCLEKQKATGARRLLLGTSLAANIGLLVATKYLHTPLSQPLIPLGISFYTWKKISYLVDVYREKLMSERHFGRFFLYVSFFPSIIAGPIDRAEKVLPQLAKLGQIRETNLNAGLQWLLWGMFKKVAIADNLAPLVKQVFSDPRQYAGPNFMLAALLYSIQLYCDFSGYSDMAFGAARIFGIRLMKNFDRPYAAASLTDFWRRWHISLSTWLRDYIFLPLAYRFSRAIHSERIYRFQAEAISYAGAILMAMMLCGLWHGANANFLVWGTLHGICLALAGLSRESRRRLWKKFPRWRRSSLCHAVQRVFTFSLVSFLWIFFRANSLADAWYIVAHLFTGIPLYLRAAWQTLLTTPLVLLMQATTFGVSNLVLLLSIASSALLFFAENRQKEGSTPFVFIAAKGLAIRWLVYYLVIFWTLIWGMSGDTSFIYRQF